MDHQIRVGVDVGCKNHHLAIADPAGRTLEDPHSQEGFAT